MSELFRVEKLSAYVWSGHLWHRKKHQILNEVSFSIDEGTSAAYLGPNGAGKTTTFRSICGLSATAAGTMYWKGRAITPDELHHHIGFLPEHPYFYHALTPRELLTGLGRLSGLREPALKNVIIEWADKLDFAKVLDQRIHTCSKGQMQRVGLTQALLHNPELLILDEPMSGLDPVGRERIAAVLQEANRNGTTILFSSHILSDAEHLCNKVIALNHGRTIFDGPLDALVSPGSNWEIFAQSAQPVRWPKEIHAAPAETGTVKLTGQNDAMPLPQAIEWCTSHQCHVLSAMPARQRLEDAFVNLLREEHA